MSRYEDIENRLSTLLNSLERSYVNKTKISGNLFDRARKVFPGGTTYHIRYLSPYPPYIVRGKGTKVWDVDGNEYLDFWMGHGAHVLGHSPDFVIESVYEASKNGTHLGFENPYSLEYAEFLTKILPNIDMFKFCVSGTEANMYVTRLARAYTRRPYVIKVEGGWHGGYDSLHTHVNLVGGPESAGLPEEFIKYTIAVPFNDLDAVENVLKKHPVAAILLEPLVGGGGCLTPAEDYLKGLRQLTYQYGSLLIFDEVITGFRLALGGGQEFFNVGSDLAVYGKVIGGGYPGAGGFGGRAEVMELLDNLKYPDQRARSYHGGTFVGNLITVTAGHTLVKYLAEHRSVYESANSLWDEEARKLESICREYGDLCYVTGAGTMRAVHFTKRRPKNSREFRELRWSKIIEKVFNLYARVNGVLYIGEKFFHVYPSLIQGREEVEYLVKIFGDFMGSISRQ
ncbi:MAG: aminotransferase class III-fold pyridoxal phosphate-dependent enzyme [Sulfolobales archaeon]|nr:aminotransferase class III-fold pyridoxal phosphate-dependent enzyme [Sulfolobales archaeon]MDW7969740.1 aminotransferase class III-fold pyridoxal phosphate-dependent enzyme [Sulfolobales archaeon]